ncbi:MAG: hypothetical protein ACI9VR_003103 [Cognaticolwellia sp.]|jgi:hypothetical protein
MVVFNGTAIIQLIAAAVPGGIAYGIAYWAGGHADNWGIGFMLGFWFLIDALWRASNIIPDEDDPESGGVLSLIKPSGGGHLFWLPGWFIAILAAGIKIKAGMG